jgi:hypothetical protein
MSNSDEEAWLFTIEGPVRDLEPGDTFSIWTRPPRVRRTRALRLTKDGRPFEPQWGGGDEIYCYYPETGRCHAALRITRNPRWDPTDELWDVDTEVIATKRRGPTLDELGIEALQGGRHRLSIDEWLTLRAAFGLKA